MPTQHRLYKTFEPAEVRRIANKLEIHFAPKHGSWLNMAEIELSILSRQCLDRRIPDQAALKAEIEAWELERNLCTQNGLAFLRLKMRVKLKKPNPTISVK